MLQTHANYAFVEFCSLVSLSYYLFVRLLEIKRFSSRRLAFVSEGFVPYLFYLLNHKTNQTQLCPTRHLQHKNILFEATTTLFLHKF